MRFVAVLMVVSGCSFSQGTAPQRLDSGTTGTDSAGQAIDASTVSDATSCADSDGDTICNAVDKCPGFDDRLDADGDTIPDGCDTWPCGATPVMPSSTVTQDEVAGGSHRITSLTGTKLGGSVLRVVAPGASVSVTTTYSITDCISPGAIDQIEVGLVTGTREACIYDANPQGNGAGNCGVQTTGSPTMTFTAPTTPGRYDFRFRIGQDYACADHTGWWTNVPPGPATTVAILCVL